MNLAGFFPPAGEQIWKSNLNWQPIPVHTMPLEEDHRLALSLFECDEYVVSLLKYLNATDYQQRFNQHKPLISYLEMKTGMKISSQIDIYDLYDALTVEKLHGKRYECNELEKISFFFQTKPFEFIVYRHGQKL